MSPTFRQASREDFPPLTQLWHDGWHEAHGAHVPDRLRALRLKEDFRERLLGYGEGLIVAGPIGQPSGFCALKPDEIDQLYVAPAARGTGLAGGLLGEGERRLAAAGTETAELLCLPENTRAAAFYLRAGWRDTGPSRRSVHTSEGPFELSLKVFEKRLAPR